MLTIKWDIFHNFNIFIQTTSRISLITLKQTLSPQFENHCLKRKLDAMCICQQTHETSTESNHELMNKSHRLQAVVTSFNSQVFLAENLPVMCTAARHQDLISVSHSKGLTLSASYSTDLNILIIFSDAFAQNKYEANQTLSH